MRPKPDRIHPVSVRRARRTDLDSIDRIEAQSFDKDRFSRRTLRRALARNRSALLIAEAGGVAAGYAMILFRKGAGVARLYSIAVDPAWRGQGVARALLEAVERACRESGADRLRLEVRSSNREAARLYERAGFEFLERRSGYYDDGEDAIRMEKPLLSTKTGDRSAHA